MNPFTTIDRVKRFLDKTNTNDDDKISSIIEGVSARMQRYMDRKVFQVAGAIEYHDADFGTFRIFLKAVDAVSVAALVYAWNRDFDAATPVSANDYYLDTETGIIYLDEGVFPWASQGRKFGRFRVTLTTGMASDLDDLIDNHMDLVLACEQQAVMEFKRIKTSDQGSVGDAGGSVGYQPLDWLPSVKDVLDSYRNVVIR